MDNIIWKIIPGYNGKYKISPDGNIISFIDNKWRPLV